MRCYSAVSSNEPLTENSMLAVRRIFPSVKEQTRLLLTATKMSWEKDLPTSLDTHVRPFQRITRLREARRIRPYGPIHLATTTIIIIGRLPFGGPLKFFIL